MVHKNLKQQNKNLPYKWLWRLNDSREDIWKEVVMTNYGKLDH